MLIGIDCFRDTELAAIIDTLGKKGTCEITRTENISVYDTETVGADLKNYITQILDVYTAESLLPDDFPEEKKNFIENILYDEWTIFNISPEKIKQIIIEIYKEDLPEYISLNEKVGLDKLCDPGFMKRTCLLGESSWENFMSSIKNMNRFHSNHLQLNMLKEVFCNPALKLQHTLKHESIVLFRARISNENGYKTADMGAPPSKKATAGRANSAGISCLYLANNVDTTLHEIRARDLDYISVGTFEAKRDLKIIDLSNLDNISPFSESGYDPEWFAINMSILKKISVEIAKPLRRQDSELDYLPAQYISDFVKSLGFDGICYKSTLNKSGLNYAIFDCKKLKCNNVDLYHINSLAYQKKLIPV